MTDGKCDVCQRPIVDPDDDWAPSGPECAYPGANNCRSYTVKHPAKAAAYVTSADIMAFGEVQATLDALYNNTGRSAELVVLHPDYLPGYTTLAGLPVVRSEAAPKDRALVAWGMR